MGFNKSRTAFSVLLALAGSQSIARQQVIECPASVPPSSIQLAAPAPEWQPFVTAPLYLHSAAPLYGPPEARGSIADFTSHPGNPEWSYHYRLEGNFADGKWIQCAYGENNEVTFSKRIEDNTEECTFTYRKGRKVAQHEIKIQCK
jgi:hypothetical protein